MTKADRREVKRLIRIAINDFRSELTPILFDRPPLIGFITGTDFAYENRKRPRTEGRMTFVEDAVYKVLRKHGLSR